jgi:bacterial/archaeal transporter family protein
VSFILLIISTVLWGVWGFMSGRAVDNAHQFTIQWMYYLPSALLIPLFYFLGARVAPETNLDGMAFRYAVIAGVAALAASLLFFFALQDTSASVAVAITASYPVVTLAIGVLAREETLDLRKIVGIGIIIIGIVVLQWES